MLSEFIVWDKNNGEFLTIEELRDTGELDIFYNDDASISMINFGTDEIFNSDGADYDEFFRREVPIEVFPYIGKKDISGNKIYADCSIVEFYYQVMRIRLNGYFVFNKDTLSYNIKLIGKGTQIPFISDYIKNLKIIDTIPENKLRLMK